MQMGYKWSPYLDLHAAVVRPVQGSLALYVKARDVEALEASHSHVEYARFGRRLSWKAGNALTMKHGDQIEW